MKVLMVIVSGGSDPVYEEHKKVLRTNQHPQVTSVFIEYAPNVAKITQIGDILYLPGVESYVGMTRKTIDSIEYLLQDTSFTHVIRTNLSSIWRFPQLLAYLDTCPSRGLFVGSLGNAARTFVSGAGMYMSRDVAERLVASKEIACSYREQDDLAISYALADIGIECSAGMQRVDFCTPQMFRMYAPTIPDIYHHFRFKQDGDRRIEPILMMELLDMFRQNDLKSIAMKAAVVTGVTGQDGSYLVELLLVKGYYVYGIARRTSRSNTERIARILDHPRFFLREADLSDSSSLRTVFEEIAGYKHIEVYNLAAQSHVHTSFRQPELTADIDGIGPLRILEIIRSMGLRQARFYQASTSELYGKVQETPQSETTPFYPRSPYGVAKLYAFWIVKNYRESYGMFACNGILFNHESERRGEEFVTRKITKGIAKLKKDPTFVLEVGNLDARRDWGYAPDYVEGMWRMLQQDKPDDYVLATGETHTVREFIETAWGSIMTWKEDGGHDAHTGRLLVKVNPDFCRPAEVDVLIGDPTKAWYRLGWKATTTFPELVARMVESDTTVCDT